VNELPLRVSDNADEQRYEGRLGEELAGFIDYRARDGSLALVHTEVDPARQRRGLGSELVAGALDDIRSRGLTVIPLCSFVRAYIRRHPEYADLLQQG
jgi:predicted GNAT family acetyltransferase